MTTSLATAIAKVRSIGDRICSNQVYCFEQYDAENFDATELCEYLGIPYTDDLFVEYPAHRTFCPVSAERIAALARELKVTALPDDYVGLLREIGDFHLPGEAQIQLCSPESASSLTFGVWWFPGPATTPVLAISQYSHACDGDSIGFRRVGDRFAPEVYLFEHERRHSGDENPDAWTRLLAGSLSEFVCDYIDSLDAA